MQTALAAAVPALSGLEGSIIKTTTPHLQPHFPAFILARYKKLHDDSRALVQMTKDAIDNERAVDPESLLLQIQKAACSLVEGYAKLEEMVTQAEDFVGLGAAGDPLQHVLHHMATLVAAMRLDPRAQLYVYSYILCSLKIRPLGKSDKQQVASTGLKYIFQLLFRMGFLILLFNMG